MVLHAFTLELEKIMIIGIPKEIKADEYRVGLTPAAARELVLSGHNVVLERGAGTGSGFADAAYADAGAEIADSATEVWANADLIVKIKEPLAGELDDCKENQTVFTYFHLAGCREATERVLNAGITAIAYETVTDENGGLPLLEPMSQIAGKLAIEYGSRLMMTPKRGCGKLLGKNPGASNARVFVLGGGAVGMAAAERAAALGADVVVLEKSNARIRLLNKHNRFGNIAFRVSNRAAIQEEITDADLLVTAVLSCGAKAPILVERSDVALMTRGGVIVDVAIDQGGCVEGAQITTHTNPSVAMGQQIYCGISNLPGTVPRSSTEALTAATFEYVEALADNGIEAAIAADQNLANGVNAWCGKLTNAAVADAHGMACVSLESAMAKAAAAAIVCNYVGC